MPKKKINWQMIFSALFLVLTLAVVISVGLSGNDLQKTAQALQNINPHVLLCCFGCWFVFLLCNGLHTHHFLKMQGKPIKLTQAIHAALTGLFYSNVTPGATGGQPMEMYRLSKFGVSIGLSGSSLAVKFIVFQIVLLISGAVLWVCNSTFVSAYASGSVWMVIVGYIINFFSVGMVLLMGISRKAVLWLINKIIHLTVKLHLCKNGEAAKEKWEKYCESFLSSIQLIIRHPIDMLIQVGISLVEILSQMLVIVFIYRGFGLSGVSVKQLITLGVLLYIGASYTPLPGASGAQEGGFAVMFSQVFPEGHLFVALLLWRFFTYYLTIIAGIILSIIDNIAGLIKARENRNIEKDVRDSGVATGEAENGTSK